MNKFFQLCAVLMMAFSFSACSLNDDNENKNGGVIICPVNWKDAEFHFNADGTMKYEASNVFKTAADMQKALVGKAFKHSFSYEINNETGKVEKKEYYRNRYDRIPLNYFFLNDKSLYELTYDEGYNADKRDWTYVEDMNIVKVRTLSAFENRKYNNIQILEYDAEYKYIWLTQIVFYNFEEKGDVPVYVLSRYDLMSKEELNPYMEKIN